MFDKIVVEVDGKGGGEGASGPGRSSIWGNRGRIGDAAAAGDMGGTWGGTPLTAAINTGSKNM